MTIFHCATRIVSGSDSVSWLQKLDIGRLLVVTDPYFAKNGLAERIARYGRQWEVYDGVEPDPSVNLAAQGAAKVKEFRPEVVVALGGGSAMDCAKAMLYFSGVNAKLVAIPTTSGSGSEVTDFAILTHAGIKHPLVDEKIRPWAAILDDTLLHQLPGKLVADAGFDVIAHSVEAIAAKNASPITDALARDGFCCAYRALPASYNGQLSVRMEMHTAATMAAMAFSQAGLGLCHAMSHGLGGLFHVPHGRLNAVLLPAVIGCNASVSGEAYAQLARAVGLGGSTQTMGLRNLKNALIRLRRQLDLPETLHQAGVDCAALWREEERLIQAVCADPCCATNPVRVTSEVVHTVLEEVAGRG